MNLGVNSRYRLYGRLFPGKILIKSYSYTYSLAANISFILVGQGSTNRMTAFIEGVYHKECEQPRLAYVPFGPKCNVPRPEARDMHTTASSSLALESLHMAP